MRHGLLSLIFMATLGAQTSAPVPVTDPFASLRFLVGDWSGEGEGKPGTASGGASYRFELDGKVLVRRNHADLAAAHGRPAARHEDLMTIFLEGGHLKALYLDNEDHVIRYQVVEVPGGVAFTSEPTPGPRFRLTYLRRSEALVRSPLPANRIPSPPTWRRSHIA